MAMLNTLSPVRCLKLSGVLDFLLLLLGDNLALREAEVVARCLQRARFDEVYHLRDLGYNPEIPRARLWQLASGRYLGERASVCPSEPTGALPLFDVITSWYPLKVDLRVGWGEGMSMHTMSNAGWDCCQDCC